MLDSIKNILRAESADGLKHCEVCGAPKQMRCDNGNVFPIMCECEEAAYAEKCAREKRRITEERRVNCIPEAELRSYTFERDDGRTEGQTRIIKAYADSFTGRGNNGLLLYGAVDTGKTFYAMCVANALIDVGRTIACTTPHALMEQAQEFKSGYLDKYFSVDVVIFDDLGTERETAFAYEQIYALINGCYTRGIPLVTTTNYTLREMMDFATNSSELARARIYSRLLEKSTPVLINALHRRAERFSKDRRAKL